MKDKEPGSEASGPGYSIEDNKANKTIAEKREEELQPIREEVYQNMTDSMQRVRMLSRARTAWNEEQNHGPDVIQMRRKET